jgi:hypothetical protein
MTDEITPVDNENFIQNIELAQQSTEKHDLSLNATISQNTASQSEESSSGVNHLVVMVHGMKGRYIVITLYIPLTACFKPSFLF